MKILERVREIVLKPKDTWPIIKGESADIKSLFINYAAPLALIPIVCNLIGMTLIGIRMPMGVIRAPFLGVAIGSVVGYILNLAGVLLGAWIVKLLAPYFNSKSDLLLSVKLVVYSMTPVWLAGVFSLVPGLGILSLLAGFYAIYLLALGLPGVLETPSDKVILYILAIIAVGFVVGLVISFVLSSIVVGTIYGPMYMQMMEM